MILAARGAGALADAIGVSPRRLRKVFMGLGSLSGPRAAMARAFAAQHGITLRCYTHPTVLNAYLISGPSGWWMVPRSPGGWAHRSEFARIPSESWDALPLLELPFPAVWDTIAPGSGK